MWPQLLLAAILFSGQRPPEKPYSGPACLGPFCIDRDLPVCKLFVALGEPITRKGSHFCYRSRSGNSYMWFERMAHRPALAGTVVVSDFPNCMDSFIKVSSEDPGAWKTDEGIGVGSREEDVVERYGGPSRQDEIKGTRYRWIVKGDFVGEREDSAKRPDRGDKVLVYKTLGDLRTAEFGIRNGRVCWIAMSQNE
jgi:hypothetical protein